jgi:hypothetical protein
MNAPASFEWFTVLHTRHWRTLPSPSASLLRAIAATLALPLDQQLLQRAISSAMAFNCKQVILSITCLPGDPSIPPVVELGKSFCEKVNV